MTHTLYISNLSHGATKEQVEELFQQAGAVVSVKVMLDKEGLGKGYGFVEMASTEEAENAKTMLHHSIVDGKEIEIADAKTHG